MNVYNLLPRRLYQLVVKDKFCSFGDENTVFPGSFTYKSISLGSRVYIGPEARIWATNSKIIIGDDVTLGPNVSIFGGDHYFNSVEYRINQIGDAQKPHWCDLDVEIKGDCWIGASAIILKGVVIGEGSVIGAGSVVTKSIEPYSVAVGNPCVVIKQRFNETKNVEHKTQS